MRLFADRVIPVLQRDPAFASTQPGANARLTSAAAAGGGFAPAWAGRAPFCRLVPSQNSAALGDRRSPREDVDDQLPRGSLAEGCFALPVERVRFDLREAPPRQRARFCRSLLHDIIPELAPDLLAVH